MNAGYSRGISGEPRPQVSRASEIVQNKKGKWLCFSPPALSLSVYLLLFLFLSLQSNFLRCAATCRKHCPYSLVLTIQGSNPDEGWNPLVSNPNDHGWTSSSPGWSCPLLRQSVGPVSRVIRYKNGCWGSITITKWTEKTISKGGMPEHQHPNAGLEPQLSHSFLSSIPP